MILRGEFRSGKISQIEGFHRVRRDIGVSERLFSGCDRERAQVQIGKCAERCFSGPDYGH